ncbi:MAG: right-handed parallel beta-helix repeat-containing protein [Phycisphaeraceae bacterium]
MIRALLLCLLALYTSASFAGEVHVSTLGDDANPGTADRPCKTLHRAQAVVRRHRAAGANEPIDVLIHPGRYELDRPLVLGPRDSGSADAPVTWRAADPDDKPRISAGRRITGQWRPSDRPGVWFIDVPGTKRDDDGGGWNFRQLFVDGERATRARFPNKDADNPFMYADERNNGAKDHVTISPALVKQAWSGETDAQINLVVDWLFFNQWNTLASIDKRAGKLTFTDDERHGRVFKNNWFYIEGFFAELDQPGEWYLDRQLGRLYYMPEPGRDPNAMRFVAPRLDRLIHVRGDVNRGTLVRHVRFDGLELRHTAFTLGHIAPRVHTDAAIRFENTHDCAVTNCVFENIGGYAMWLHLDCQRNTFSDNAVRDSGGGGVLLTGARLSYMDDSKIYTPGEAASKVAPVLNRITHNTVKHCGRIRYYGGGVHLDSRPANMSMLPGNLIAHNHFEDLSRNGVFAFRNQGGNVVAYNHIHDAMQTTIDGACIHFATMNRLSAPNTIAHNWLYDVWGFRYLPNREPRRVLANGVFLDWDTSNTTVANNYVYNSGGEPIKTIWENWDLTVENNHTSDTRIVPPFIDQLGPGGDAANDIDLASRKLVGGVIHYTDDANTKRQGGWQRQQIGGQGKLFTYHLIKAGPGDAAQIQYTLPITRTGRYQVSLIYKPGKDNATNARVRVHHAGGVDERAWDMTKGNRHGFAVELGTYKFERDGPASVTISTQDADGWVIADSVGYVLQPGGE